MVYAGQSEDCAKYDDFTEHLTQTLNHTVGSMCQAEEMSTVYQDQRKKRKDTISFEANGYAVKQPIKGWHSGTNLKLTE